MNYYQPRQKKTADGALGLWYYTVRNGNAIWSVGYCAHGCRGHETPEAAREHYRQYCLDESTFDGLLTQQKLECNICKNWTQGLAHFGGGSMRAYPLCDAHRNRESLDLLTKGMGDAISSW